MTDFSKILVALLDDSLVKDDFSKDAGFIDCYTEDDDIPKYGNEYYLMYDDSKRTEQSIATARKLSQLSGLINTYSKRVNNKPVIVYSVINPNVSKYFQNVQTFNTKDKTKVLNFWGNDNISYILSNGNAFTFNTKHKAPKEDEMENPFSFSGVII